ncbi:hypothetical protein HQQ94_05425 [Shewanella sp. VB17]|uniref:hypothetical protein n=1 Tax=Shewanella sp. VB17 TaxID=2739432 RepID=UPI001567AA0C|nr:hypothetical protein [Shewanella sp. VB17]NRD72697.1 hypothetical protein [Shewanella sp. VB17]
MSTQETGALIESVNNMTAAVAGKMGEIDGALNSKLAELTQKANEINQSVLNSVGKTTEVRYLDPINGDDANDGKTLASAYRTLKHCVENTRHHVLVVRVAAGAIVELNARVHCYSDVLRIEGIDGQKYTLRQRLRDDLDSNEKEVGHDVAMIGGGDINIIDCNLETAVSSNPGTHYMFWGHQAYIQKFQFSNCKITINDFPVSFQIGKINLYSCLIESGTAREVKFLMHHNPFILTASSLKSDKDISDYFGIYDDQRNVLTNLTPQQLSQSKHL